MKLEWMGRYREVVRAFVYYSNTSNRTVISKSKGALEPSLSQHEYQVLEYICEFEDDNKIMTDISNDLGIIQSNITKAVKALIEKGLAERYRLSGNRKNNIIKPTEYGKRVYSEYCRECVAPAFEGFFDSLSGASDEQLKVLADAVMALSNDWNEVPPAELEKII